MKGQVSGGARGVEWGGFKGTQDTRVHRRAEEGRVRREDQQQTDLLPAWPRRASPPTGVG